MTPRDVPTFESFCVLISHEITDNPTKTLGQVHIEALEVVRPDLAACLPTHADPRTSLERFYHWLTHNWY